MERVGVVGLSARDVVDGGAPRLGGAPFYAAQAFRLLGERALVATKLAEEDAGLLAPLHALGLPVARGPAGRTASFRIENRGEERAMAVEDPGEPWSAADARSWLGEALAGVRWVHAGALTRADFPAETLAVLARGRVLSLDGQGLARRPEAGPLTLDGDFDRDVLRHVGIVKLAEDEAAALGLDLAERALASLGVKEVLVTLGSRGCVVYADGLAEVVKTRPFTAHDATGAGDVFMAAYLAHRRRGHPPVPAAALAGGLVRTWLGGR